MNDFKFYKNILLNSIFVASILVAGAVEAQDPLRVGALIPLTGQFAPIGEDCRNGLIAGKDSEKFSFVFADSQADPKIAVTELRRLLDTSHIVAAIAPRSPVGMALNPISMQAKLPLLGQVAHRRFAADNPFAFMFWGKTDQEGEALAKAMMVKGQKKVAIITAEDDWTLDLTAAFVEAFKAKSGAVLFREAVTPTEMEFSTLISRIKALQPDAIFVNLTIDQIALVLKRINEQHLKVPIYSNFWVGKSAVMKAAGETAEGVGFMEVSLNRPGFRARVKEPTGKETASAMTFWCYAAAVMLSQTFENTLAISDAATLYSGLLAQQKISLPDAEVILHEREAKADLVLKTIHAGMVLE